MLLQIQSHVDCTNLKQAMKHDPRSFDLATSVDVTQFGEVQTRGQLRETVGGSLSNSHFVAPRIVTFLARLGDALIMFLAAMISAWRYPDFAGRVDSLVFFSIGLLSAIALPLILEVLGLYRLDNLIMPAKSIFNLVIYVFTRHFAIICLQQF